MYTRTDPKAAAALRRVGGSFRVRRLDAAFHAARGSHPKGGHSRAAFTLIEVLVSVAVLAILVVFVGRVFNEALRAWRRGMSRAEQLGEARVLFDTIARDLSTALANSTTTFYFTEDYNASDLSRALKHPGDLLIYSDYDSTVLFIASVNQRPGLHRRLGLNYTHRAITQIRYTPFRSHREGRLWRWVIPAVGEPVRAHYDPEWVIHMPGGAEFGRPIGFKVQAFTMDDGQPAPWDGPEFYSRDHGDRLPLFTDVLLETLAQEDRRRLTALGSQTEIDNHIRRLAQRHATRVYFPHRTGYAVELQ